MKPTTTVEPLPGGKAFLFRFHVDPQHIPGDVVANCVVAETAPFECEVKAWGGKLGPTVKDMRDIKEFCKSAGFKRGHWRRYKNGQPPKLVVLFDE